MRELLHVDVLIRRRRPGQSGDVDANGSGGRFGCTASSCLLHGIAGTVRSAIGPCPSAALRPLPNSTSDADGETGECANEDERTGQDVGEWLIWSSSDAADSSSGVRCGDAGKYASPPWCSTPTGVVTRERRWR